MTLKPLFLIGLLACSAGAFAAKQRVLLETPVTYHPDAEVAESVKRECQVEAMLTRRVGAALSGTQATDAAPDADVSLVRLRITHVLGVGGGAWSGPKGITVSAEFVENGKVSRQTKVHRWSSGGMFAGFKGTCDILDRSAVAIGRDLSKWVRDASYKVADEPPPKAEGEAPPATAPAASGL